MKKWTVRKFDGEITEPMIMGLGSLAASALSARGITDGETANNFFCADKIYEPFLLKDMDRAVGLIKDALAEGRRITVYGDYDCDGITATVMLYEYLTALGGETDWYIPSRDEGYGLNAPAIEKISRDGTRLIITVDNGIAAVDEARLIKEKGMGLIITDHHTPLDTLPEADAIINPKRKDDEYPFKDLAGCGVVLKLIAALENSDSFSVTEQYGDLAALGTIGDIVPLVDENRHIVSAGLQSIEYSENIGLYCLINQAGLSEKKIDAVTAAYIICPRINAAGRFSHPSKAAELLLCENPEVARAKAAELNSLNTQRSEEERKILIEIDDLLNRVPSIINRRVIVIAGEGWHHGIIGIICAKMVTRFGKPCVIISAAPDSDKDAKGSCRSIKGFSVHEALKFCGDLLVKFGGHQGAGGLTVLNENIEAFTARIQEFARLNYPVMPVAEIFADGIPRPGDITVENVEKLETLQPFGDGNPVPAFLLSGCVIKHKRSLKDGKYIAFEISYSAQTIRVLDFSKTYSDFWYKIGDTVDLMLTFSVNEYNDAVNVNAKVLDIRLSGINQERYFAAKDIYEKLKRGEQVEPKLLNRVIPDERHMKAAYDIIKNTPSLDEFIQRGMKSDLNYCMLRVIADVFAETGIVDLNPATGKIKLNETSGKADLSKSELLKELKEKV